jgi:hypothetical protein
MPTDIIRSDSTSLADRNSRWWHFGMVWFVLSGPALVVVAGFATMAIAFIHADVELHEPTPLSALSIRIGGQGRISVAQPAKSADLVRQEPAAPPR